MAYLIRNIAPSRWRGDGSVQLNSVDDIKADTIIKELKTENNRLSWWRIEKIEDLFAISIAYMSNMKLSQRDVRFIVLPYELIKDNFDVANTPENGLTAIPNLKQFHYDIYNLTFGHLKRLSEIILQEVLKEGNKFIVKVNTKKAIEEIEKLLANDEVEVNLLGTYVKRELGLETETDLKIQELEKQIEDLKKISQ